MRARPERGLPERMPGRWKGQEVDGLVYRGVAKRKVWSRFTEAGRSLLPASFIVKRDGAEGKAQGSGFKEFMGTDAGFWILDAG